MPKESSDSGVKKKGHKNKNGFTRDIRACRPRKGDWEDSSAPIRPPGTTICVPPVGHCGAGFRDKTKRDTAADLLNIIFVHKATRNIKCFFSLLQIFEQNPSARVMCLRPNIIVGLLAEPTLEEFCGGQETGHSKGKTATRLQTKPAGRKQFGGQMENTQAYLDQAYLAQA